jgi:hypothetical protein
MLVMVDLAGESLSFWNELTRIVIRTLLNYFENVVFFYWNGEQVT